MFVHIVVAVESDDPEHPAPGSRRINFIVQSESDDSLGGLFLTSRGGLFLPSVRDQHPDDSEWEAPIVISPGTQEGEQSDGQPSTCGGAGSRRPCNGAARVPFGFRRDNGAATHAIERATKSVVGRAT